MEVHGGGAAVAVEGVPGSRPSFSPSVERSSPEPVAFPAALGLAAATALLLDLSFPHPRQGWLAWVALVPFLVACRRQGPGRGALLGLVMGIGFHGALLSWTTFFGPVAAVGLVLFKSLAPAVLGAALGACRPGRPLEGTLFAALGWVAMEYAQTWGPLGITWGMLSHSQARVPVLIQVGSLVGPWGLSFVLAFFNAAVAEWALRARPGFGWGPWAAARVAGPALATAAGLVGLVVAFGAWRLAHPPAPAGPPVAWGAVQVSMPQDVKWDPSFQDEVMNRLETLSAQAARQGARVIVWPETSIPFRGFLEYPGLVNRVGGLSRQLDADLLVGSIERAPRNATYNTAVYFERELGTPRGRYDKVRLVPFGEFLPWKDYLPPLPQLALVMNYASGPGLTLLGPQGREFAVLICFESMVPDLARAQALQGARFLVIPTNDAWFGRSSAAAHHFEMAIMRAVETGRPTIQAGNTGISGFITPLGQVLQETALDERRAVVASLAPVSEITPYCLLGDVLAWACLAGALGMLAQGLSRRPAR